MREARETQPVGKQEKKGVEEDVGPALEHGAEEASEECMVSEEHGFVVGRADCSGIKVILESFRRYFEM